MKITCLHTIDVHVPTFTQLFADLAPKAEVHHVVRDDLLARAQIEGVDGIRADTIAALEGISSDVVLCTCSTLGAMVDALDNPRFLRVDRPMMEAALQAGPNVLMAICLESTRAPSLELLERCADDADLPLNATVHVCAGAWPFFENGDEDAFTRRVAASIRDAVDGHDSVVLAQASMRGAAALLDDLGIPVLASPALAVEAAVARAS